MITSSSYNTRSKNVDNNSNASSTTSSVTTSENIIALETKLQDVINYQINFETLNV